MLDGAVMKRNALPLKGKHECTPPEREAQVKCMSNDNTSTLKGVAWEVHMPKGAVVKCTPPEREGALAAVADVGVTTAASDNRDSDNHRVQHG